MKNKTYISILFALITSVTLSQWVQIPNGIGSNSFISGFAANGNNIFTSTWDTAAAPGSIYISTNDGNTWSSVFTLSNGYDINCLSSLNNNIFAGADRNLWISTNNGMNWSNAIPDKDILGLGVVGSNIFAGAFSSGNGAMYKSTNNGLYWVQCNFSKTPYCFTGLGLNIFTGTSENGVYISNDGGINWDEAGLLNRHVHSIAALNGKLFAGTENGLYISTNNGQNWSISSIDTGYVFSIIVSGSNLMASVPQTGIYLSTNEGVTWILKNEGLPPGFTTLYLKEFNNNIFLGTYGNSVYRRPISQVFGINQISSEIPTGYSLEQNFPNPFNPTTNIRFDVQKTGFISIKIYDMLGREIAVLVNENLKPGTYQVDWDGTNFTSGVYFYTMRTEGYTETKRMVLIK